MLSSSHSSILVIACRTPGTLRWKTMTTRMMNSQPTLNLCVIFCSSLSLWDQVEVIPEYSKTWLKSLEEVSQWFFSGLRNLKRFQWLETGICHNFRGARGLILINPGLSVPLQWLIKSQRRLFWVILKNNVVIGHSQNRFMGEPSCSINLISSYDNVTHLVDQGKPVNVIFFAFLLNKISSIRRDKHIMRQIFNLGSVLFNAT